MSQEKKYLGIDWGEARIGLALGDNLTKIATPFEVLGSVEEVVKACQTELIDEIVLGDPIKMNPDQTDSQNSFYEKFLRFKKDLEAKIRLPVHLIDERLSSRGADALAGDKKTKASRDALAAMLILQAYLDSLD